MEYKHIGSISIQGKTTELTQFGEKQKIVDDEKYIIKEIKDITFFSTMIPHTTSVAIYEDGITRTMIAFGKLVACETQEIKHVTLKKKVGKKLICR